MELNLYLKAIPKLLKKMNDHLVQIHFNRPNQVTNKLTK